MADFVERISAVDNKTSSNTQSLTSFDGVVPRLLRFREDINLFEKPTKIYKRDLSGSFILGNPHYGVLGSSTLGKGPNYDNLELQSVVLHSGIYYDDFSEHSFVDFDNTTATVSENLIEGNGGDVFQSDWIVYNNPQKFFKVKFDFSQIENNLSIGDSTLTFPLTFPFTFQGSDMLYVSTDGSEWFSVGSDLEYEFDTQQDSLKWRLVFGEDGKYIRFKDSTTKQKRVMLITFS